MWVCLSVRTNSNSWKELTDEDEGGGEDSAVVRLNYWLYAIDYLVPKYLNELFVPTLVCLWDAVAAIHLGKDNLFFPTVL